MRVGVIERERTHALAIAGYSAGLAALELELGVVIDGAVPERRK